MQFVFASIAAYPFQNRPQIPTTPADKPPVPVYKWGVVAAMFFCVNMLNNWAFAFNISVPVHIILRSFGSVTTMGAGWLRGRRYSKIQLLSVVMLTLGVIQSAWADSESKVRSYASHITLSSHFHFTSYRNYQHTNTSSPGQIHESCHRRRHHHLRHGPRGPTNRTAPVRLHGHLRTGRLRLPHGPLDREPVLLALPGAPALPAARLHAKPTIRTTGAHAAARRDAIDVAVHGASRARRDAGAARGTAAGDAGRRRDAAGECGDAAGVHQRGEPAQRAVERGDGHDRAEHPEAGELHAEHLAVWQPAEREDAGGRGVGVWVGRAVWVGDDGGDSAEGGEAEEERGGVGGAEAFLMGFRWEDRWGLLALRFKDT